MDQRPMTGRSPGRSTGQIKIERTIETIIFQSRWLLAPLYLGLVASILVLLGKFVKEFLHIIPMVVSGDSGNVIVGVLSLVDIVMIANLLVLIIFAGYENFVSVIDTADHEDRPEWMGHVTFSDLKIKLIGSIVAISGIELLKAFMNLKAYTDGELAWKIGLHLTFVVSGVLFAMMDKLSHKPHKVPAVSASAAASPAPAGEAPKTPAAPG
jgi:uncharacterized protein (TIGR00645 family)